MCCPGDREGNRTQKPLTTPCNVPGPTLKPYTSRAANLNSNPPGGDCKWVDWKGNPSREATKFVAPSIPATNGLFLNCWNGCPLTGVWILNPHGTVGLDCCCWLVQSISKPLTRGDSIL